jgi:16S rRNA processing protein RimM
LNGTVRVEVLTDRPEDRFTAGAILYPEGAERRLAIAEATPVADGPGWWLRFRGVPDRSRAEPLVGTYLEAVVPAVPEITDQPGAVWWHEVVGAEVRDREGHALGHVRDVYRAGGAEVYAVDGGPAGSFDVPAVSSVVVEFAPRQGWLVVDTDALGLEVNAPPRRARGRRSSKRPAGPDPVPAPDEP